MSILDQLKTMMDPKDDVLTEEEYQAAYDWINANKDDLSGDLKWGLLKLINGEMHRRMFSAEAKDEIRLKREGSPRA